jgi:8-oxo-dGTP pyrophosphatase MutT (NUDIX family)
MARERAVVTIILRGGQVLSISRGEDTSNWGLPGGHVERGETLPEAMVRELREETGVVADIHIQWRSLGTIHTDNGKHCTYLIPQGRLFFPRVMRSVPFEGYVEWKWPEELLTPSCVFRDYHYSAFHKLGIIGAEQNHGSH